MNNKETIKKKAKNYRAQFLTKKACLKRINKTINSFNKQSLKTNALLRQSFNNVTELRAEILKNN